MKTKSNLNRRIELNKTLFQFQNFRQINLNYIDKDLRKNQVKIINQKNYNLMALNLMEML